jgi:hypothetical protein
MRMICAITSGEPAMIRRVVYFCAATTLSIVAGSLQDAHAVEGSMGTYLLGSRDLVMGVVPPPGVYVSNDVVFYQGNISAATNLAGAIIEDATLQVLINKTTLTAVAPGQLLGGSVGMSFIVPFVDAHLDATGSVEVGPIALNGSIDAGNANGLSDITIMPMIGWHNGKVHYSFAVPLYLPTGSYRYATIDASPPKVDGDPVSVDALNPGKNRFAVDPTFNITYLDPKSGLELDASLGVVFSTENKATDYQSGAEMHFEGTMAQRLPGGWLIGATGHYYQQLQDDSGAGAEQLEAILLTNDLKARVFGLGPVLSYSTKVGGVGVTWTAKYLKQFGAEKHIEGESGWLRGSLSF